MIFILLAAFFTGLLSKLTDLIEEHGLKLPLIFARISGIIYGFLIAFVVFVSPELSALWVAVVVSLLVLGKINSSGHYLGIASMAVSLVFLGVSEINVFYLLLFFSVSFAEEIVNDKIVDKNKIKNKLLNEFMKLRPLIELTALIVSFVSGKWIIWLGILAFDFGYILMEKTGSYFSQKL
ncbi:MAG: hypothetical protein ABH986_04220 [archaeon]